MKATAALATAPKGPFEIVELSLDQLRPDEDRVKLVSTGVGHTDAIVRCQRHQADPVVVTARQSPRRHESTRSIPT